ncbi:MAG: SRPBCC domain-containing protein [Roseiflexaceae bacterium]
MRAESQVLWPVDLRPDQADLYAVNSLRIAAAPEAVWAWLVRAASWPQWYANCRRLVFEDGPGPDLRLGTRFSWTTFGARVHTTVEEYVPAQRLAWRGQGLGAEGYHGWVILPQPGGCLVITEEVQRGLVPRVARFLLQPAMLRQHQRWLEGLVAQAQSGPPV